MKFKSNSVEFDRLEMEAMQTASPIVAYRELAQGGLFDVWGRLSSAQTMLNQNISGLKLSGSFTGWSIGAHGLMQSQVEKSARQLNLLFGIGTAVLLHEIEAEIGISSPVMPEEDN